MSPSVVDFGEVETGDFLRLVFCLMYYLDLLILTMLTLTVPIANVRYPHVTV